MFWRRLNLTLSILWAVLLPVSFVLGLAYSVAFVSFISLYNIVVAHIAAWRADVPTS